MTRKERRRLAGKVSNFINAHYKASRTPRKTAVMYVAKMLSKYGCDMACWGKKECFCAAVYYIYYELMASEHFEQCLCKTMQNETCVKSYANMRLTCQSYRNEDCFFCNDNCVVTCDDLVDLFCNLNKC